MMVEYQTTKDNLAGGFALVLHSSSP